MSAPSAPPARRRVEYAESGDRSSADRDRDRDRDRDHDRDKNEDGHDTEVIVIPEYKWQWKWVEIFERMEGPSEAVVGPLNLLVQIIVDQRV